MTRAARHIGAVVADGTTPDSGDEASVEKWRASHVHILNARQYPHTCFSAANPRRPESDISFFNTLSSANTKYFTLEKQFLADNIVLVRGDTKEAAQSIANASQNYFADTVDDVKKGLFWLKQK